MKTEQKMEHAVSTTSMPPATCVGNTWKLSIDSLQGLDVSDADTLECHHTGYFVTTMSVSVRHLI